MDEYYQEKEKEERKCIKTRRDIHSLLKIRTDGISGFVSFPRYSACSYFIGSPLLLQTAR